MKIITVLSATNLFLLISFAFLYGPAVQAARPKKSFQLYCQWANNLNRGEKRKMSGEKKNKVEDTIAGTRNALSLLTDDCGPEKMKTCFGQVVCNGNGKDKKNREINFDFYTYAVCVGSVPKGPKDESQCPSASQCLKQSGKLSSFANLKDRKNSAIYAPTEFDKEPGKGSRYRLRPTKAIK